MSQESSKISNVRNKPQNYNMKFLDLFLKKMKWSKPQFAQMIGMTKASVYHWFKVDDIQLTTLYNAFDKIGYEIVFSMEMPNIDENINIEIGAKDEIMDRPRKRLDFLHTALYENDIDQHKLAKYLGRDVETIDYWFRYDNCHLHYIFKTAKFTGMKLKIAIRPVENSNL